MGEATSGDVTRSAKEGVEKALPVLNSQIPQPAWRAVNQDSLAVDRNPRFGFCNVSRAGGSRGQLSLSCDSSPARPSQSPSHSSEERMSDVPMQLKAQGRGEAWTPFKFLPQGQKVHRFGY